MFYYIIFCQIIELKPINPIRNNIYTSELKYFYNYVHF